jgi:hypothetical protein
MGLKAYQVTDYCQEISVLVFAENRNQARMMANQYPSFDVEEWIFLRGIRVPLADIFANRFQGQIIDGSTEQHQRVLRACGFYQGEFRSQHCEKCERYEWPLIPESKILEVDEKFLCAACKNKTPFSIYI